MVGLGVIGELMMFAAGMVAVVGEKYGERGPFKGNGVVVEDGQQALVITFDFDELEGRVTVKDAEVLSTLV